MSEQRKLGQSLRIIWAIAAKDIVDALKNKQTAANIITIVFLLAIYKWLPAMGDSRPYLFVYDAGDSQLVTRLENLPQFRFREVNSMQTLEELVDEADAGEVGLVIPADFDQVLEAGGEPELDGAIAWVDRFNQADIDADLEEQLGELLGQPVRLNIAAPVPPTPDSMGPARFVAVTLVITTFLISTMLIPHLMLEEKQAKTMSALLVSPANSWEIVLGKALAGLFYCLTTAIAVFVFNWVSIVNWGLAVLVVLCGGLFAIALGLVLGTFLENRQQFIVLTFVPSSVLLIPVFLNAMEPILPAALRAIITWIPTVSTAVLFRYACSSHAPLPQTLAYLGVVLGSTAVLLAMVAWKVRRMDRS